MTNNSKLYKEMLDRCFILEEGGVREWLMEMPRGRLITYSMIVYFLRNFLSLFQHLIMPSGFYFKIVKEKITMTNSKLKR